MSNWVYSGCITKDNVAKFHEDFDKEVLPVIQTFLQKYNLGEVASSLTYGNDGMDIKIRSKYTLSGGCKPWAESNFREMVERAKKSHDESDQYSEEEKQKFTAFYTALPKGDLIGKHVHIPGSSKRHPNETFTFIGYEPNNRYPVQLIRDRDGAGYQYDYLEHEIYRLVIIKNKS